MTDVTNTRITRNITACKNSSTFRVKITEANFSDLKLLVLHFQQRCQKSLARAQYIYPFFASYSDGQCIPPFGPKWIPMARLISD